MAGQDSNKKPIGGVKTFACPNCGGTVQVRAPGQTLVAACIHCGTTVDIYNENYRIIDRADMAMKRKPLIPLGNRGRLDGKLWEVIGFMVRQNRRWNFSWEEYLLFNPVHGFRFLVNSDGHWTLMETVTDKPNYTQGRTELNYKGNNFKRFFGGVAHVDYVLGEFYWKVKRETSVKTLDFIAPPLMISGEQNDKEQTWSYGTYIEPEVIKEAFGVQSRLPRKRGISANQPNPYADSFKGVIPLFVVFAVLAIVLQFVFNGGALNKTVMNASFAYEPQPGMVDKLTDAQKSRLGLDPVNSKNGGKDDMLVSEPFKLEGGITNVKVVLLANVENNWLELEGSLHKLGTAENYNFLTGVEYYHGVTDGESWSEGGKEKTLIVNSVPEGEYELVMKATGGTPTHNPTGLEGIVPYRLELKRDVSIWSNFWMLMLGLALFPGWLYYQNRAFEKKRWDEGE